MQGVEDSGHDLLKLDWSVLYVEMHNCLLVVKNAESVFDHSMDLHQNLL